MKSIILTSESEEKLELIRKLAAEMGIQVSTNKNVNNTQLIREKYEEFLAKGGLQTDIKDPAKWERELRKDRNLPF